MKYEIGIDEAAFYGPKLDIQYKNVFGKEDTLVTIQIDMLLAERFGMYYKDKDGQKKLPYIIHRTSLGCYERTLAYMIEHFGGAMPLWLAPEQVRLVPIADRHLTTLTRSRSSWKLWGCVLRWTTVPKRLATRFVRQPWRRFRTC